jgi:predicted DNA-binding ribbon-helix-helix protein
MRTSIRNEIKAQIVREGLTMQQLVEQLSDEYGWSESVSNLSAKLQRESLRYIEAVQMADVMGYDLVWQKRREK